MCVKELERESETAMEGIKYRGTNEIKNERYKDAAERYTCELSFR